MPTSTFERANVDTSQIVTYLKVDIILLSERLLNAIIFIHYTDRAKKYINVAEFQAVYFFDLS